MVCQHTPKSKMSYLVIKTIFLFMRLQKIVCHIIENVKNLPFFPNYFGGFIFLILNSLFLVIFQPYNLVWPKVAVTWRPNCWQNNAFKRLDGRHYKFEQNKDFFIRNSTCVLFIDFNMRSYKKIAVAFDAYFHFVHLKILRVYFQCCDK